MIEDRLLVWRFNSGDADALGRIYQKYRTDLLKVAAALLEDRAAMEDVLHDVFVNFAQTSGRFHLRGSLKGYLSVCVANRARDMNRATQRRRASESLEANQSSSESSSPYGVAVLNELTEKLESALARLPFEQQEIIVLHLQSGLRFRQIAMLKEIPLNTALSRYHYGLKKIRLSLNGDLTP